MIVLPLTPWFAKPVPGSRRLPSSLPRRQPEAVVYLTAAACFRQLGTPRTQGMIDVDVALSIGRVETAQVIRDAWMPSTAFGDTLASSVTGPAAPFLSIAALMLQLVHPLAAPGWAGADVVLMLPKEDMAPEIREAKEGPVVFLGELALEVPGPAASQFVMHSLPAQTGRLDIPFPAAFGPRRRSRQLPAAAAWQVLLA